MERGRFGGFSGSIPGHARKARRGEAWFGVAGLGWAGHGVAGQGKAWE
jgi:hypothetical protein